jgi:SAM-dependent methyltransferase
MPRAVLAETADDGDFLKQHLVNPALTRMLGDVAGRRVLDAGCGNGYFSRMLARAGAEVTGIEPAGALFSFATGSERAEPLGIRYRQADLCSLTEPGRAGLGQFDAVVASMVLPAIPDWRTALAGCVAALRPGGRLVFSLNHPCFEQLASSWREHGRIRSASTWPSTTFHCGMPRIFTARCRLTWTRSSGSRRSPSPAWIRQQRPRTWTVSAAGTLTCTCRTS